PAPPPKPRPAPPTGAPAGAAGAPPYAEKDNPATRRATEVRREADRFMESPRKKVWAFDGTMGERLGGNCIAEMGTAEDPQRRVRFLQQNGRGQGYFAGRIGI